MKISDGRINYLSRRIAKLFISNGDVDTDDIDFLSKEVKKGFIFFLQREEAVDKKVREKISSIKRGVPEGSTEWDILYRQYYNDEISKS